LSRKEFLCPLCKSLGNCLLPVLWGCKHETVNWTKDSEHNVAGEFSDRKSKSLSSSHFSSKLSGLVNGLTFDDSNDGEPSLLMFCSRLVTVVKIVYKHINPEYRENFVGLNYLDLLWYNLLVS
jgi:hypothetical protein